MQRFWCVQRADFSDRQDGVVLGQAEKSHVRVAGALVSEELIAFDTSASGLNIRRLCV